LNIVKTDSGANIKSRDYNQSVNWFSLTIGCLQEIWESLATLRLNLRIP